MKPWILTTVGIITLIVGGYLYAGTLREESPLPVADTPLGQVAEPEPLPKELLPSKESLLKTEQDALYAKYGEYVQVKEGVSYTKDAVVSEPTLTSKTSTTTEVNVYDGPQGKGYQTVTKTATATVYTGYGPEANDRTYTVPFPVIVASSTKR